MDIITTKKALSSISCDLLGIAIAQTTCDEDALSQALSCLGDFGKSLAKIAVMDDFKGKLGSKTSYATFGHIEATRIVLLGAGDGDVDGIRRASGTLGSLARVHGAQTVCLSASDSIAIDANAAREGFGAGNYQFDKYKSEDKRKSPAELLLLHNVDDLRDVDHAHAIAAGQSLARDLVNEPAAVVYPQSMAEIALGLANDNLTVEVWNEDRIADAGMGGIIGVGQGSSKPARFIHMTYKPEGKPRKRLALVGKGVTFDSGGLSLKPAAGMLTMRCDMAGAAAVIGAMRAIRDIEPDVEVHGIVGAVENMNDGNSYKVGDILKMYNGKTVEVHNTDAEGRLVLADCLSFASELGVDAVIDAATLTGACVVALGSLYTGLFSDDAEMVTAIQRAAEDGGESVWPMPLPSDYRKMIDADWGQIKNVGKREAGAITAALFLKEFVDGPAWAHLDIAGPAFYDTPFRHFASGGSGAMVPTLTRWVCA